MRRNNTCRTSAKLLCLLASVAFGLPLFAQQYKPENFKQMKWRLIGPFRGGRVEAVTGVVGRPNKYYFGAVGGGVWETTDGGVHWKPIFDKEPIASIGAIAVAASDPNVIYVGTGEPCLRGDISYGDGVYRSTDGGKTWENVGLKDTRHIASIVVDPRNPDVAYVAAVGHAYGPNAERGVFKTTDGGKTWDKILFKDDKSGAIDLSMDPNNPRILFAALWQVQRTAWGMTSGGPGSSLYKTVDSGKTWKKVEGKGWPKGILGRIGVAISGADSERVYAQVEAKEGGLYRSDDGGKTWELVNEDHRFLQRAWYYMHIFADPKAADTVYELNVNAFRSTDGGKTFKEVPVPHGDNHALWIDPTNPKRMIEGNDGGATITVDGGKTWSTLDNQPTAQFYHVITDNRFPYYIYGSQQDNTTVAIPAWTNHGDIERQDWYQVGGGESGYIAPYPPDPNIVYGGSYEGVITRFNKRTEEQRQISPWPEVTDGFSAAVLKHRFNWTSPIVLSPQDPNVLYYGGEVLFETRDDGFTWKIISPDLTRNDKSKQQLSGGPITKDNTGTEYYDTIFTVAPSPLSKGLIWVGSDDGLVHLTRDDGGHWDNVTPKDVPAFSLISLIDASTFDAGSAFMAVDRHKSDDFKPYIYKTTDYGKTWTEIDKGIPDGAYVHAVREDPDHKGLLFAGTETGIYVSFDDGGQWQPLQLNLPVCPVHDLAIKRHDLIAATHGRAFWVLDDITPLEQLGSEKLDAAARLFAPAAAYRLRGVAGSEELADAGQNPPAGAIIDYYLRSKPKEKQKITMEILDSQGKVVRRFSNIEKKKKGEKAESEESGEDEEAKPMTKLPAKEGLNRFVWDLHYPPPREVPGMSAVFSDWTPDGAWALPGKYQVTLTVDGKDYAEPLEVRLDPRNRKQVTPADLQKQFELATKIQDRANEVVDAVNEIIDLRAQVKALKDRFADRDQYKPAVDAASSLDKKLKAVEDDFVNPKIKSSEDSLNYPIRLHYMLVMLEDVVESADGVPTAASYTEFDSLSSRVEQKLSPWHEIETKDIPEFNKLARKAKIQVLTPLPPKPETAGE